MLICRSEHEVLLYTTDRLSAAVGKKTTDYIPETPYGYWERDDIWRYALPIGKVRIVVGWQVYRKLDLSFLAVPVFTIKKN